MRTMIRSWTFKHGDTCDMRLKALEGHCMSPEVDCVRYTVLCKSLGPPMRSMCSNLFEYTQTCLEIQFIKQKQSLHSSNVPGSGGSQSITDVALLCVCFEAVASHSFPDGITRLMKIWWGFSAFIITLILTRSPSDESLQCCVRSLLDFPPYLLRRWLSDTDHLL